MGLDLSRSLYSVAWFKGEGRRAPMSFCEVRLYGFRNGMRKENELTVRVFGLLR